MNVKAIVCVFVGHRWTEAADVHETYPVLRCRRCGREQGLGGTEAMGRSGRVYGGRSGTEYNEYRGGRR